MSEIAFSPPQAPLAGEGASNLAGRKMLVAAIGEAAMISLAEQFGGTRLYVPSRLGESHPIARAIGAEAAQALRTYVGAPGYVRVPLARDLRATKYRAEGLSNGRIAARLGLTEGGVLTLFNRLAARERCQPGEELASPKVQKEVL